MMLTTTRQKTTMSNQNPFRLLFTILLIACISGISTAQQVEYQSSDFQGQWFIGMGVGPRIYFADHARQLGFMDRLSLGADLYVGKWFIPFVGARLGTSYQTLKGAAQNWNKNGPAPHANTENGHILPKHGLFKQQFDAFHIYGDLLFNVSSIFEGVNEDRFWTLTPFIGLGYARTVYPPYHDDEPGREVSLNIGLLNSLHVGYNVDLNFDIRGAMVRDRFKVGKDKYPAIDAMNMGGRPFDGILSVNIGVAFRFGGSSRVNTIYWSESVHPVAPPVNPQVVEKVKNWKDVATDVLILFRDGENTLSRQARVQLSFLARLMHEYPEGTYTITGYADDSTGNQNANYGLSSSRAERVKDCLVREFGISPSRLQTAGTDSRDYRYNDPAQSRSAIIRPNKY
jgi:flagellar motor protein MotB